MLGRANKEFQAAGARDGVPQTTVKKPGLAKHISQSHRQGESPNGSIVAAFKKSSPASTTAQSSARLYNSAQPVSRRSNPLAERSHNIMQQSTTGQAIPLGPTAANAPLVSLCGRAGSFKDELDVGGYFRGGKPEADENVSPAVYISDGDLSDDIDLDYEAPSALPGPTAPLPSLAKATKAVGVHPTSSAYTWSQSSPSHYLPPLLTSSEAQRTGSKRSSSGEENDGIPTPPPAAKKRALPSNWHRQKAQETVESMLGVPSDAQTPAHAGTMATAPWDQTTSAVKAQRKQLKEQQKKPAAESETTADEIRQIVQGRQPRTTAILLSVEQNHVKDLVVEKNQSVFFTGPAGTGKSVLMRAIIAALKKKWQRDPERVAVTASTGLAACNIGGMTLHSFAGIGLGKEDAQTLVRKIRRNPKAKTRWLKTKVLIIDEVSMVDGELFDKLSQIGRIIRNNGRPWGGIQLVITGDFFQLPPVPDGDKKREIKFAFEAATWNTSISHTIGLTEVFRQKDPEFAQMLNEMRLGRISEQTVESFKSLTRPLRFDDGLEVTELFPTRNEVDSSNERRIKALNGTPYRFNALDSGEPSIRDRLLQNMMAPKMIELKKGAQVMLIKNMDETLVNGSLGTVIGFMNEKDFSLYDGDDEAAEIDGDADPKFKARMNAFKTQLEGRTSGGELYPAVRFHAVDGTYRTMLCLPEDWKVELPTGEVQASRKQLPLILAWALSIHKAQGQTMERVKVDLGRVFEKGQAYVALSRATSKQGLQVLRFDKQKVMAHPRVVQFYNQLDTVEATLKKKAKSSIKNFVYKPKEADDSIDLEGAAEEEAMAAYG